MKKLLLLLLSVACLCAKDIVVDGYVEGEYVYLAPSFSGILEEISVVKGQQSKENQSVFAVDATMWQLKLNNAQNSVQAAKEQLLQSQAIFSNAKKEWNRAKKLIQGKAISQGEYDMKLANFDSANARVAELETQLAITEENLQQTQRQYAQNVVISKVNGIVSDVYVRLGEFVAQGNPVVAILPPQNVKIRFFVAEKVLPTIHYNKQVFVSYDNAPKEILAKVSYIATSAEYTPPIIYSIQSRDKLVFMIEATFENLQEVLNPGLPVSVRIP